MFTSTVGDRRKMLCIAAALGASSVTALSVFASAPPAGPVVLTIKGKIGRPNAASEANFDLPMLERLPQRDLFTQTPWHQGRRKFTGPLLRDLLNAVDARGSMIRAIALNDYKVDIPFEDAVQIDVVMARLLDDRPMPVRDKGPLFIIYPFDDRPELRNQRYYARCAWQLRTLEIV
jgi:hypothetical protein